MSSDAVDDLMEQWRRERPDLEADHLAAAGTVNRIARFLTHGRAELESALAPFGLKLGEFDVLSALRRGGPPFAKTPGQLLRDLFLSSGAMTNRIDRLETLGYVERRQSTADGRAVIVALTPAGRRTIDDAIRAHLAAEHRLLEPLGDRERRQLDRIARALIASAQP